jgi:hypothetical protein
VTTRLPLGAILLSAALALPHPASSGACSFSLIDLEGKAVTVPDAAATSTRLVVFYRGHW